MKGARDLFTLIAVLLAVALIAGAAVAAQGGRAGRGNKAVREGDVEATTDTASEETAATTESEETEGAEADHPNAEKTEAEAPKATPEELAALLEKRLKGLQAAVEKASVAAAGKIPGNMDALSKFLPGRKKDTINPETDKPLVMNAEMAGKYEDSITKPKEFITFYADAPTADRGRAVIFADGTFKYLPEEDFKKALTASKPRELSRDEMTDRRESRTMGKER